MWGRGRNLNGWIRMLARGVAVGAVALSLASCGALSSLTNTQTGLSSQQANSFASQIAGAFSFGMKSANASRVPVGAVRPVAVRGLLGGADSLSSTIASSLTSTLINIPINSTTTCTAGGSIHVLGSLTGSMDQNGTGVLQLQLDESILDWQCISGYVMNGDPEVSATGTFSFVNGQQGTAASIDFGGGFKWGTSASESCPINLTALFNPDGSGTLSGTMCNTQVNTSF